MQEDIILISFVGNRLPIALLYEIRKLNVKEEND